MHTFYIGLLVWKFMLKLYFVPICILQKFRFSKMRVPTPKQKLGYIKAIALLDLFLSNTAPEFIQCFESTPGILAIFLRCKQQSNIS